MRLILVASVFLCLSAIAATNPSTVTFTDVAPILAGHCQECHRPGEVAPMSFLTYRQVRPWAKAIKEAVLVKKMPPWFADPHYGKFRNDRSLTQKDIDTLVAWADQGAPEGGLHRLAEPPHFVEGWNIEQPDMVLEMPEAIDVPASGAVQYQYLIHPYRFTEDRWVRMVEVRPSARSVVHHVAVFIRAPESTWLRDHRAGEVFTLDKPLPRDRTQRTTAGPSDALASFGPGIPPIVMEPSQGRLIPAGSDLVFELHYTANGKATQDQSKVGLVFCKERPKERVMVMTATNTTFAIPPGDANYRIDSEVELGHDVRLMSLMPHMHLRGKDFEFRLIFPDGKTETILRARYDFAWQLWYDLETGIPLPKGTKIACTAHFDNSPNNPLNPDPRKEVRWGEQSWEEMMSGLFSVAFPADMNPKLLYTKKN